MNDRLRSIRDRAAEMMHDSQPQVIAQIILSDAHKRLPWSPLDVHALPAGECVCYCTAETLRARAVAS